MKIHSPDLKLKIISQEQTNNWNIIKEFLNYNKEIFFNNNISVGKRKEIFDDGYQIIYLNNKVI